MRKMRNGRREKGYDNDMYGSSDFDQMNNKVHCSVDRHKQGSKRNPRVCGTTGRNRRLGATTIIEVTHMNNNEKVFYLLVYTNIICCICN
jgi:ribonuclease PH